MGVTSDNPTHHNIHEEESDGQRQSQTLAPKEDSVNRREESSVLLLGHQLTGLGPLLRVLVSIAKRKWLIVSKMLRFENPGNSLVVVVCRLVLVVVVVVVVTLRRCSIG